jgi:dynein heavy chain
MQTHAQVTNEAALKSFVEEKLEEYNYEPGFVPMRLVLFRDALGHLCRISRVIRLPRGNALLVGVGGSGRQSLTRLAAYIAEYKVFMIEISKSYRALEFKEDLKKLYDMAGTKNQSTVRPSIYMCLSCVCYRKEVSCDRGNDTGIETC